MAFAVRVHGALGWDQNQGVVERLRCRGGKGLDQTEVKAQFNLVNEKGLQGGVQWDEGRVENVPRLLMEAIRWGESAGGVALNYAELVGLDCGNGKVRAVVVKDRGSGDEFRLKTKRVALCLGAADDHLAIRGMPKEGLSEDLFLSYNLIVRRSLGTTSAVAVAPGGGRGQLFFLIPMGEVTLAGTRHDLAKPGILKGPPESDLVAMVNDLRESLPAWPLVREDVIQTLSGLIPEKARGDEILDLSRDGGPAGVVRVRSSKFTTAPVTAARALNLLSGNGRLSPAKLPKPTPRRVLSSREFLDLVVTRPREVEAWASGFYAAEKVRTVSDFVSRRMDWGLDPDRAAEAAGILRKWFPEELVERG